MLTAFRRIGRAAFPVLLTALLIELTCRAAGTRLAPPAGWAAVTQLLGHTDTLQRLRPHPYLLYENTPHFREYEQEQHNSLGYRGPEFQLARTPGVVRILALGGSTTYGWLLHDSAEAWPGQLERILRARGRQVEVINGGLNSATSAELLLKWMFRDRYLDPDVVVVSGPGNDVWPLMYPNYDPEYTHYRRTWDQVPTVNRAGERRVLRLSATARVLYAWWLDRSQAPLGIFRDPTSTPRLDPAEALDAARRTAPLGYERNMTQLVQSIVAAGATPLLFKMVRAPRQIFSLLPRQARAVEPLYDAVEVAQAKEADVGRRLARTYGVPWIELSADAVPLAAFLDHTHLNAEGERIRAEAVAAALAAVLDARQSSRQPDVTQPTPAPYDRFGVRRVRQVLFRTKVRGSSMNQEP